MKRILLFSLVFMFTLSGYIMAQRTVTGSVTGEDDGTPIPGVNVIVKGTSIGTVTDIDGKYQVEVPADGTILVFSFIGLATEEVEIGAQSVIDMVMTADIHQLTEIVVTAVGIESTKASLGYSIQSVKSDEIVDSRETNLVNALNSKVAGVQVISASGSPGASAMVRIRGNTSITGSNQPLFVIDGVPINNSSVGNGVDGVDNSNRAIDLNPHDVASLTVLKGPAATALYGIRAANGAVIITTKKGAKGVRVDFSTSYTASQVNKLPEQQNKYAQGRPVGGVPTWRGPETFEGFSWGPEISSLEFDGSEYDYDKNGRLVAKGSGNGMPAQAYDNVDNFYVTGGTSDNNLSISGATDKINYFMSAGYLDQKGIVPNSDFARTSLMAKVSGKIVKNFEIGMQANYVNSGGNRIQRGSNISGVMLGLMRNTPTFDAANGYTNGKDAVKDESVYMFPDGSQRSYRSGIYDSPFWTATKNPYKDDVNRIIGNAFLKWDVNSWFTVSYKLGVDQYSDERKSGFDVNSAAQKTGQILQQSITNMDLNSDLLFMFNKNFGSKFNLNAVVGHNYFSTRYKNKWAEGTGFGVPDFFHISNASSVQAGESISNKEIFGVFGDVKLSYNNYLFLNVSARNDWSSALPEKNNSFLYPAFSLGWAFTETFNMQGNRFLSYGKLRASWGQVGNDAPIYATADYFEKAEPWGDGFTDGLVFPAFGVNAFSRDQSLGNQELHAELTTTMEFGGELQFAQGRVGFDVTWYNSSTDGQVIGVDIAPSTGYLSATLNAGLIENTGWEVMFNAQPVKAGAFTWDMDINFTKYETLVKELDPNLGKGGISMGGFVSSSSRAIEGQPFGVIYGNRYQRTDDGSLLIGDDGWPLADSEQGVIGDPTPDWFAGFRNSFSWKGLTVSGLLDIRQGGDVWNGTVGVMNYFGMGKETEEDRNIKGYVIDGKVQVGGDADNPVYEDNTTPVDFANPANGVNGTKWTRYGFGFSEDNIEDASWVRLRELTVSYSFPKSLIGNSPVEAVSIAFTGRNLWLHTKYSGIDPETNLTGGTSNAIGLDYFNMPNSKSYGVAFNITF